MLIGGLIARPQLGPIRLGTDRMGDVKKARSLADQV